MIKYTRSLQKLSADLKYILGLEQPSLDSRAILLVLAATMSKTKFGIFIDSSPNLNFLNKKLKDINALRQKYGDLARDYIVVSTMQMLKHDICSDELQRMIGYSDDQEEVIELRPALVRSDLETVSKISGQQMQKTAEYLIHKLDLPLQSKGAAIVDTYLHCRNSTTPAEAFHAVIFAMARILEGGGLDPKNSLLYSYKLANHTLKQFVHDSTSTDDNSILHVYKTMLD